MPIPTQVGAKFRFVIDGEPQSSVMRIVWVTDTTVVIDNGRYSLSHPRDDLSVIDRWESEKGHVIEEIE